MVAVVVAAVVILAVLVAAGYVFHKASTGPASSYTTFDQAVAVAGPATGKVESGSWSPVLALGVRIDNTVSLPLSDLSSLGGLTSNCTVSVAPGAPTVASWNATPASAGPGQDAFWIIGFTNGSGTLLLMTVNLGTAQPLYTLGGSGCSRVTGYLVAFPSDQVNSPTLVANANASGGAAYLSANPGAAQVLLGIGGINLIVTTTEPIWNLVDTSCPVPFPVNETGSEFNASFSGSGAVESASTHSLSCSLGLTGLSGITLVSDLSAALSKAI